MKNKGVKLDCKSSGSPLDYRELSEGELFQMMHQLEIFFDRNSFVEFCQELDSPEEFSETLSLEGDVSRKAYLIAFELWRRFIPENVSISLFCDELDRTIALYEKQRDHSKLLMLLEQMVEILDRNDVSNADPQVIFKRLCLYVAHDLENVIYTYIDSQLSDSTSEAIINLLDHFMPYVKEKRALLFLKLKSMNEVFLEEKQCLMEYLTSSLQESINFSLSLAMLFYLIEKNQDDLFKELFSFLVYEVKEERGLVSLLDVLIAYHQHFGQSEKKKSVSEFMKNKFTSEKKAKITKIQKNKVLSLL